MWCEGVDVVHQIPASSLEEGVHQILPFSNPGIAAIFRSRTEIFKINIGVGFDVPTYQHQMFCVSASKHRRKVLRETANSHLKDVSTIFWGVNLFKKNRFTRRKKRNINIAYIIVNQLARCIWCTALCDQVYGNYNTNHAIP
jgi:hypothetical protein